MKFKILIPVYNDWQSATKLLENINNVEEVSIGHALICDTFEYGLEKTVKKYLSLTKN